MKIYSIPAANIGRLREEIEKMNRRARKLGKPVIELSEIGYEDHKNKETGEIKRTYQVQVAGELPGISGWRLVAVLNHDAAKENVVKVLPGETLPESYRTADAWCDHCKTNRYRTDTFVLGNEISELKQVGRNCLADFLREGDAENIATYWERYIHVLDMCEEAEDYGWRGCRGSAMYDLDEFLRATLICTRAFGWCSAAKAKDEGLCATADDALSLASGSATKELKKAVHDWQEKNQWSEKDSAYIQAVITWAKALGGENDYLYNLGVIARANYITVKTYRLAASMIIAYEKANEKEAKQREAATVSNHFGTVRKRDTFTLKLEKVIQFTGEYGTTHLHIFHDVAGNRAIWFGSNQIGKLVAHEDRGAEFIAPEYGETIKVKATVKAHEERNGVAQTILTRCKLV